MLPYVPLAFYSAARMMPVKCAGEFPRSGTGQRLAVKVDSFPKGSGNSLFS